MPIPSVSSHRLFGELLSLQDASFIHALLNSEGWLKYIGDRQIHSIHDAENYIKRIQGIPNFYYWVVRLKATNEPIGIITFLQRDYLVHPDIGFAFLPAYHGKGFAYEITNELITQLFKVKACSILLGITLPVNTASIKLLETLHFQLEKEFIRENETLLMYVRKIQ
ncbi:MAG: hypothetical protein RL115_1092 [Bacteroidota bacterium]|jgi:RimJ/RimL family protein N-acetyltransferase